MMPWDNFKLLIKINPLNLGLNKNVNQIFIKIQDMLKVTQK